ncbi:MAG: hypothetical protein GX568_09725 [Candidatus Gastranaerophilales bacterium]|nr:hypothetical protein [Candidatus Gastranaerophilales bacterium]
MDKKQETKRITPKKRDITIKSLDIDKAEYRQIVLSQSNYHDRNYFRSDY